MSILPQYQSQAQDNRGNTQWFHDGILYEVFVRSFRDSNGDGIGDLQGVIDGLDYIQSLGANTIWLMPIHPSPSYHGYDVEDYYGVNPVYGTLEDMYALIDAVHERSMYIIIDYVANHSSSFHPFFQDAYNNPDSEYSDFYKWVDDRHTNYQSFAGVSGMPELNYEHDATREYMIDVARFWLDPDGDGDPSDGVDGFRCDVAIGPPLSFWRELRIAIEKINPNALMLGEVWLPNSLQLQDYLEGDTFNALFDFPTLATLIDHHDINGDGAVSGAKPFEFVELSLKASLKLYPEEAHLVRFINNHDTNRFMSEVDGDIERAKAAAVWLLTAPDTPMIYYGEEIGMFGSKGTNEFYDEYRREPMDWYASGRGEVMPTWFRPGDRFNLSNDGISIEEQDDDENSLLNHYRRLGALRNSTPALRGGFGTLELSKEGVDLYAIWRGDLSGDYVIVVINFSTASVTASVEDDQDNGTVDLAQLELVLGDGFSIGDGMFTIEPAGYAVLTNFQP